MKIFDIRALTSGASFLDLKPADRIEWIKGLVEMNKVLKGLGAGLEQGAGTGPVDNNFALLVEQFQADREPAVQFTPPVEPIADDTLRTAPPADNGSGKSWLA